MNRRALVAGAAVGVGALAAGTTVSQCNNPPTPIVVPASVPADCSADATAGLNTWLASLPANSTAQLGSKACYLVSNDATSLLAMNGLSGVTLDGNGATLKQTHYAGSNAVQPILSLTANTNVTVENLTIMGPGGSGQEGDYGLYVGGTATGNTGLTFNRVTVQNTAGDSLTVVPQLGQCCGINTNVTFENGAFINPGYHTIVPEGVNGLTISNDTFTNATDMDMEVDLGQYGPPFNTCDQTPAQGLEGVAQCNITLTGNHFINSHFGIESSSNGACIPHGNFKITNNSFTDGAWLALQIEGSQSNACPRDDGLTITGNTVTPDVNFDGAIGWYSCGITTPPCGAAFEISDYQNVDIENNQFLLSAGSPSFAANTINVRSLALQGDENVTIKNNGFNNGWNVWSDQGAQWTHTEYPNVNITACGDSYWLTKPMPDTSVTPHLPAPPAQPKTDPACS